jgi:hypothetical protein
MNDLLEDSEPIELPDGHFFGENKDEREKFEKMHEEGNFDEYVYEEFIKEKLEQ